MSSEMLKSNSSKTILPARNMETNLYRFTHFDYKVNFNTHDMNDRLLLTGKKKVSFMKKIEELSCAKSSTVLILDV